MIRTRNNPGINPIKAPKKAYTIPTFKKLEKRVIAPKEAIAQDVPSKKFTRKDKRGEGSFIL